MNQWYVKDLSKLTHISIQTLHHYDRIDLLKPSIRLPNGYRLYAEKDLLKLQQIIALKYFGFELAQIKTLLVENVDIFEHLSMQSQFLAEKANTLFEASNALKSILSDSSNDKSIPWERIIKLIEVYRMTDQLEKTWIGKVLNSEELKEYANFQKDLNTKITENEKEIRQQDWADIVNQINANLDKDPTSDFGIAVGKRSMDWVNNLYGKKHVALRFAIWEKGLKHGHGSDEHGLSPACAAWLDKAIYAYHSRRIKSILNQAEAHPTEAVFGLWDELLTDMYGDNQDLRNGLIKEIMKNEEISQDVKNWLAKYQPHK